MTDQKAMSEHDFGWWNVPGHATPFRLTWRESDRRLRLLAGGGDDLAVRLGQFDLEEVRSRLEGWGEAPHAERGGALDGRWLAQKFPALRTFAGEAAFR